MRLVIEKLPLLAVAAVSCVVDIRGQGAVLDINHYCPFWWRVGNAPISCAAYVVQSFLPVGLAPAYPRRPLPLPSWQIGIATLVLGAITAVSLASWRKRPWLLVGWLWYLGMLAPVIGFVQFGAQAEADRFTYLPQIGLAIGVVWAAADALGSGPRLRPLGAALSACVVVILAVSAWRQTWYWHDSETLWNRVLACTSPNAMAHYNLGTTLAAGGRIDEAIEHYRKALEIKPGYAEAYVNLGNAMAARGQMDEAIARYRKAAEINPGYAEAYNNLGNAMAARGRSDEAIEHYRKALEIKPDYAEAHNNLGNAMAARGRIDEAIEHYRKALEINPDYAEAHNNLGNGMAARGRIGEAIEQFQKAIKARPDYAKAHCNLGRAFQIGGQINEAIAHYRKALVLAQQQNNVALAEELSVRLQSCEAGAPRPAPRPPSAN